MPNKVKIGVIPAAGAGKRLGYLSGLLPKTLFPLYDRPIIHYVVDQMQNAGIEDIYIVVNVFKEKVINYFDLIKLDLKANLHFIEQKSLNGTAEAILLAEKYIKDNPFMVIYGDDCTVTKSLHLMIDNFAEKTPVVMEGVVREFDKKILSQTCSVKLKANGKMYEIIEKPENPPYMLRGCGVYIFSPEIFEYIRKTPIHPIRNEREITYTINMLAKEGKAYGHIIDGHNVNINDSDELLKASHLIKMLKTSVIEGLAGKEDHIK
jgi:dTDP-glucose pyrophosphorylase